MLASGQQSCKSSAYPKKQIKASPQSLRLQPRELAGSHPHHTPLAEILSSEDPSLFEPESHLEAQLFEEEPNRLNPITNLFCTGSCDNLRLGPIVASDHSASTSALPESLGLSVEVDGASPDSTILMRTNQQHPGTHDPSQLSKQI